MLRHRPGSTRLYLAAVAALLLGSVLLSGALAMVTTRPSRVVVVPGVKDGQIVVAEQIPDSAVKKFALFYLYHFDGYTPIDVEARSNYVLQFVAPEHQEKVVKSLSERATFVLRAKEASQVSLPLPSDCEVERLPNGHFRFSAIAQRRIYIAGELKSETKVRYLVDLKPCLPTEQDPYGFLVVGQSVRLMTDPAAGEGGHADH